MIFHVPVMLEKSIEMLKIKPDGIYVDATYGGGSHSAEILKKLNKNGKLIAIDQDEDAIKNAKHDINNFMLIHGNFKYLKNYLKYLNISEVDGIFADLGLSWYHVDNSARGFSYRFDTKLDMRMNYYSDFTAEKLINEYSFEQLSYIFKHYGELTQYKKIAEIIINERKKAPIKTTGQLCSLVVGLFPKNLVYHNLSKLFQALRIEVNKEIECLKIFLKQTIDLLKPGGRLAILTYHSVEDKIVKNFMKTGKIEDEEEIIIDNKQEEEIFKIITKKPITPSNSEIRKNKRSRSAKLRVAEKI